MLPKITNDTELPSLDDSSPNFSDDKFRLPPLDDLVVEVSKVEEVQSIETEPYKEPVYDEPYDDEPFVQKKTGFMSQMSKQVDVGSILSSVIPGLDVRPVGELDTLGSYHWFKSQEKTQEHQDHYDSLRLKRDNNRTLILFYALIVLLPGGMGLRNILSMIPRLIANFSIDALIPFIALGILPAMIALWGLKSLVGIYTNRDSDEKSTPRMIPGVFNRKFFKVSNNSNGEKETGFYVVLSTRGKLVKTSVNRKTYEMAREGDLFWIYSGRRTLNSKRDTVQYEEEEINNFIKPLESSTVIDGKDYLIENDIDIDNLETIDSYRGGTWFKQTEGDSSSLQDVLNSAEYAEARENVRKITIGVVVFASILAPIIIYNLYKDYIIGEVEIWVLGWAIFMFGVILFIMGKRMMTFSSYHANKAMSGIVIDKMIRQRGSGKSKKTEFHVSVVIENYNVVFVVNKGDYDRSNIGSEIYVYTYKGNDMINLLSI